MKHLKYSLTVLVFLALLIAGCAKPPEAEKAAAQAAMDAAVSAEAVKYAPTDFEAAKQLWDTAEAKIAKKQYEEAKMDYVTAKADFEKVATAAQAAKQSLTDEANTEIAGLEEAWKNLEAETVKVEEGMKDKKEMWDADINAFNEGLTAAKGMVAADPAAAKVKGAELKAIIDKWDATVKELAAAPPKVVKKAKKKK